MSETEDFSQIDKNYLSSFNDSKLQILRLNNSWVLCNNYRRVGQLNKWKFELDTVWDELKSKAKKKKLSKCTLIMKIIDLKIESAQVLKNNTNIYDYLREKHQYLKWIQDEVGMGMKMITDEDDDIEE